MRCEEGDAVHSQRAGVWHLNILAFHTGTTPHWNNTTLKPEHPRITEHPASHMAAETTVLKTLVAHIWYPHSFRCSSPRWRSRSRWPDVLQEHNLQSRQGAAEQVQCCSRLRACQAPTDRQTRCFSLASLPASTRLHFTRDISAGGARRVAARNKGCSVTTC